MIYKDGQDVPKYVGDWTKDQKHGQGRYVYRFATYQGEWFHGKRGGIGIQIQMVDKKKLNRLHVPIFVASVYEGTWLNGFPHGRYYLHFITICIILFSINIVLYITTRDSIFYYSFILL